MFKKKTKTKHKKQNDNLKEFPLLITLQFDGSTASQYQFDNLAVRSYTYTVTDSNGCIYENSVQISPISGTLFIIITIFNSLVY